MDSDHAGSPEHTTWRPLFTSARRRDGAMEGAIRRQCVALIDGLVDGGSCAFVADFARRFPTTVFMVFMVFMGLPVERLEEFLRWEYAILHPPTDGAGRAEAMANVTACFRELIARRCAEPRDDELLQLCVLLFLAGLDTVTAQLSYAFWHLAGHDADRARITAEPGIVPDAVEELLRASSPVLPARELTRDADAHGCPMKADDMVMLPLMMANRDSRVFDDPQTVAFDRPPHAADRLRRGPAPLPRRPPGADGDAHRQEWHRRIPDYRVPEGARPMEHASHVLGLGLGLDTLPLAW